MEEYMNESEIDVMTEVVIESLEDVKEQKQLIPAAKNVKLTIKKAEIKESKDKAYRWLNLQLQLVDGIDEAGAYKNKVVFGKICYYADMVKYGGKDYFDNKQHLVELKRLLKAIGMDLANIKINPVFLAELKGKIVMGDILQTKPTEEYDSDNEVRYFKPVSVDSLI